MSAESTNSIGLRNRQCVLRNDSATPKHPRLPCHRRETLCRCSLKSAVVRGRAKALLAAQECGRASLAMRAWERMECFSFIVRELASQADGEVLPLCD